jgi:hypothetical protein
LRVTIAAMVKLADRALGFLKAHDGVIADAFGKSPPIELFLKYEAEH